MKQIPLGHDKFSKVDDEDFDYLMKFKWHITKSKAAITTYAAHSPYSPSERIKQILMHRLILGLTDPKIHVDHIDHDGLNNQRSNLRLATPAQNRANRSAVSNRSSKYVGVSLFKLKNGDKVYSYWRAAITKNYKLKSIGNFKTEEDAARAYDKAAKEIHGEFANLNFR